jgi:predicted DCC family thiol-disulfide oxidoreductase YuxK
MEPEPGKVAIFYDGSCPLCRSEIGYYRRRDEAGALCFVDVSEKDAEPPKGITRLQAMQRFHVLAANGTLLSGAPAFVAVWSCLPRWRWAARIAQLPPVMALLALGYRAFLPLRPWLSPQFGHALRMRNQGPHQATKFD